MNLKCLVCTQNAEYLYKGNSLCQAHFFELEESGRGDTFLEVIIKRYVKREQAAAERKILMSNMPKPSIKGSTK